MERGNWSYRKFLQKTWGKHLLAFLLLLGIAFGVKLLWCSLQQSSENSTGDVISLVALVLSFVAFMVSVVLPTFRKPILILIVENPPAKSTSWDDGVPSSFFHRIAVINDGLSPAENCFVKLIDVRTSDGFRVFKFDPVPLYWTHQNKNTEFKPVTIFGRGDINFVDILHEKEVLAEEDCTKFNKLKDRNHDLSPTEIGVILRAFDKEKDKDKYPLLRTHLPDPEKFPITGEASSPGDSSILIPGVYFLLIGVYADNGYSKPKWYKLDITLSSRTEIQAGENSKVTLTKVNRKDIPST